MGLFKRFNPHQYHSATTFIHFGDGCALRVTEFLWVAEKHWRECKARGELMEIRYAGRPILINPRQIAFMTNQSH